MIKEIGYINREPNIVDIGNEELSRVNGGSGQTIRFCDDPKYPEYGKAQQGNLALFAVVLWLWGVKTIILKGS